MRERERESEREREREREANNANSIDSLLDRNFTLFRERRAKLTHGSYSLF